MSDSTTTSDEPREEIDDRSLLVKYMGYIADFEGTMFLTGFLADRAFTAAEMTELRRIEDAYSAEDKG